ncbi:hypothetical protein [Actinoplanes subtropicus]|uniref:hypothetical protein n=1 Tax=Actinoplanes subtropicus TaxID=543632 RepID=UPI000B118624|nr:hypothetical protein [Actinoplanes subtropicus]
MAVLAFAVVLTGMALVAPFPTSVAYTGVAQDRRLSRLVTRAGEPLWFRCGPP